MDKLPDVMGLYNAWNQLESGASAQLRRTSEPDDLRDIPAFYRLVQPFGWENPQWQKPLLRMVFCLSAGKSVIHHIPSKTDAQESGSETNEHKKTVSIGAALAYSNKISEPRLYQLLRAEWPKDMVQLRRLIAHAEPRVDWPHFAKQLYWWHQPHTRRQLLEDFVLTSSPLKSKKKSA